MKRLSILILLLLLVGAVITPEVTEAVDLLRPQFFVSTSDTISPGPAYWNGGHQAAKNDIIILATPPIPMFTATGIRPGVFFLALPRGSSGSHESKSTKAGRQVKSH